MAYGREKNIGKVFGELTVLEFVESRPGSSIYKCLCICGEVKDFYLGNLRRGKTKSCGCKAKESRSIRATTHGDRRTRLYSIWTNMKTRCENENSPNYEGYGAKGVTLCTEWSESYEVFKEWAVCNGYTAELTIDRIDNGKGYRPDNCRWATHVEQSRNRDYAWHVTIDGITKHAKEWCEEFDVKYKTACSRKYRGWSDEDAVTKGLVK